jgi:hypothetical protein
MHRSVILKFNFKKDREKMCVGLRGFGTGMLYKYGAEFVGSVENRELF